LKETVSIRKLNVIDLGMKTDKDWQSTR